MGRWGLPLETETMSSGYPPHEQPPSYNEAVNDRGSYHRFPASPPSYATLLGGARTSRSGPVPRPSAPSGRTAESAQWRSKLSSYMQLSSVWAFLSRPVGSHTQCADNPTSQPYRMRHGDPRAANLLATVSSCLQESRADHYATFWDRLDYAIDDPIAPGEPFYGPYPLPDRLRHEPSYEEMTSPVIGLSVLLLFDIIFWKRTVGVVLARPMSILTWIAICLTQPHQGASFFLHWITQGRVNAIWLVHSLRDSSYIVVWIFDWMIGGWMTKMNWKMYWAAWSSIQLVLAVSLWIILLRFCGYRYPIRIASRLTRILHPYYPRGRVYGGVYHWQHST